MCTQERGAGRVRNEKIRFRWHSCARYIIIIIISARMLNDADLIEYIF